jgi:hypothetical protein
MSIFLVVLVVFMGLVPVLSAAEMTDDDDLGANKVTIVTYSGHSASGEIIKNDEETILLKTSDGTKKVAIKKIMKIIDFDTKKDVTSDYITSSKSATSDDKPSNSETQNAELEACQTAQADAESETNGFLWFGLGCMGGLGILLAYLVTPTPPVESLIGKKSTYIAWYTKCYAEKSRDIMTNKAWWGCGVVAGAYIILEVIEIASVSSYNK